MSSWVDIWASIEDEIQVGDPVQVGRPGMSTGDELTVIGLDRGMARVQDEFGGTHMISLEVLMPHPASAI